MFSPDDEFPGHNSICHAVERELMLAHLATVLLLRLDGDWTMIRAILDAMHELPEAA